MSERPDLSSLMQMMNEIRSKSSQEDVRKEPDNSTSENSMDMEMMMKITKMMSAMNSSKNNAETNLLYALKPFLRESKKEKIDQYVQVLKMSSVLQEMNQSGGSSK